jgi:hypothetical protein
MANKMIGQSPTTMPFATWTWGGRLVIFLARRLILFQLLIDLEELSLTWIDEPLTTLSKNVAFQQGHFMPQLLDQLLLLFNRFGLYSRRTSELIELLCKLLDRRLLRFDQRLAGIQVVGNGKVGCHP